MSCLAVDVLALVPVNGVIADQGDDTVGEEMLKQKPGERASQRDSRPRRAGQDALVVGEMSRREMPEGANDVGDGAPPGGQHRADQQGREPLVRRVGEGEYDRLHQRARLGW
jgi:hypothetical protein